MSSPFVAEIRAFPFNFAPKGWAFCNGQILPLSQNTALFSLLGTTYGGDGKSNFALPNLQGNVPLHVGGAQPGPGLSFYDLGETTGTDTVSLLSNETPAHQHQLNATTAAATSGDPAGLVPAIGNWNDGQGNSGNVASYSTAAPTASVPQGTGLAGSGLPHNNLAPYLTLNFCIALQGVYPPRP
jgi:microcystin-dependent protein